MKLSKKLWHAFVDECRAFIVECFMPFIAFAKKIARCRRK